jgi:hypothetical protein
MKSRIPKYRKRHNNKSLLGNNSILESWIPGVEVSKHFTIGVPGIVKCETPKSRKQETEIPNFWIPGVGGVKS